MNALAAVRTVHFAVCIQAVGALLFLWIVDRLPAITVGRRWLVATALIATLAVPPSGLAWLTLQAANMTDSGVIEAWTGSAVTTLMWQSQAGIVWWSRAALAAALAFATLLLAIVRRPAARWIVFPVFAIAVAQIMSCAWLSHAASDPGPYRPVHLAVHSVHMLGAALWFGGLLPLAILLSLARRRGDASDLTVACSAAARFSTVALIAVALVVITGLANQAFLIGNVTDFATNPFLRLLAFKLGLFAAMLVLATVNRQILLPRLATAEPRQGVILLNRSVWAEVALAALVLLVVGELGISTLR